MCFVDFVQPFAYSFLFIPKVQVFVHVVGVVDGKIGYAPDIV